jgi:hypothetical protein
VDPQEITEELEHPGARNLLGSATLLRLAYNGSDGFPRVIDLGDTPAEAKALLVRGLASVDIVDGGPAGSLDRPPGHRAPTDARPGRAAAARLPTRCQHHRSGRQSAGAHPCTGSPPRRTTLGPAFGSGRLIGRGLEPIKPRCVGGPSVPKAAQPWPWPADAREDQPPPVSWRS